MILLLKNYYNSTRFKKRYLRFWEKYANSDFSYSVGMKLDKSYVEIFKKNVYGELMKFLYFSILYTQKKSIVITFFLVMKTQ